MKVIVQFTPATTIPAIRANFPDIEVIRYSGGVPPSIQADAFVGGYDDWDGIARWLSATQTRWLQLVGAGIDSVPRNVLEGRTVTCARGAVAQPISEWVMAAILSHAKRFPSSFVTSAPSRWNHPSIPMDGLSGAVLGLVGLGGIGTRIAELATAFRMQVQVLRRTSRPSTVPGVRLVDSIEELVAGADHVVLAAPATSRTRGVLSRDAFSRMKRGVHIVNIARGSLIDQHALREALDQGIVARASLDVVEPEPLPSGHWMYSDRRVLLSPHASWYTSTNDTEILDCFLGNLDRFIRGTELQGIVDLEEEY